MGKRCPPAGLFHTLSMNYSPGCGTGILATICVLILYKYNLREGADPGGAQLGLAAGLVFAYILYRVIKGDDEEREDVAKWRLDALNRDGRRIHEEQGNAAAKVPETLQEGTNEVDRREK